MADFIIANCQCSRKEATPIGQGNPYFDKDFVYHSNNQFSRINSELLDKGNIFEHVKQSKIFEDKTDVFYRLVQKKVLHLPDPPLRNSSLITCAFFVG